MQSEFVPDDTRRLQLQGFIGSVCVNSTGRLGIVTHVYVQSGGWACGGFGLDGKGVWSSGQPIEISPAEAFFNKLTERFNGRLSYLDTVTHNEMKQIADMVATRLGDHRETHSMQLGGYPTQAFIGDDPIDLEATHAQVASQIEVGADNNLGLGGVATPETD